MAFRRSRRKRAPDSPAGLTSPLADRCEPHWTQLVCEKGASVTEPTTSSNDDDDEGLKEDNEGGDEALQAFHERDKERKRELIQKLAGGAAIGTAKGVAQHYHFGDHFIQFVHWLMDKM